MKYEKTEAGKLAFKMRSGEILPRMRSLFLLFDGIRTTDTVLEMASGLGAVKEDIEYMVACGVLAAVPELSAMLELSDNSALRKVAPENLTDMQLYARAWPIATQITASLGLRGFRLNLAVEAAMGYEQLCDLLPKIQQAVGVEKARPLEDALKRSNAQPDLAPEKRTA